MTCASIQSRAPKRVAKLGGVSHHGRMRSDAEGRPEQRPRGLFSGYERYSSPTDEDYAKVMQQGLVVLDTNALLNLYRYTTQVRIDLLTVLSRLGDRLWLPDHVIVEFWRRRESAIRDYSAAAREFEDKLALARRTAVEAFRALGNRIGLDDAHKKALAEPLEAAFARLSAEVVEVMGTDEESEVRRETHGDWILAALEPILQGRVGAPLDSAACAAARAEAERRAKGKVPPGYADASKKGANAEGDYLIWSQVLAEAASRDSDLLFVTGDVKEDWWRRWGGVATAGPRYELLEEFDARVGRRFYMLQPAGLLARAKSALDVPVDSDTVAQALLFDEGRNGVATSTAFQYHNNVTAALHRVTEAQVIAESEDGGPDFGLEAELRNGAARIAVIYKFVQGGHGFSRLPMDQLEHLVAHGFDAVMYVANGHPAATLLQKLKQQPCPTDFVVWRDPGYDEALQAAVSGLFARIASGETP